MFHRGAAAYHGVSRYGELLLRLWSLVLVILAFAAFAGEKSSSVLRVELERILLLDQKYRSDESTYRGSDRWLLQAEIDAQNLDLLIPLVQKYGWPNISQVGEDAAIAAFLVVQHADLAVQEKYLPVIEERVAAGEAKPAWFALLTDRIRVTQGRPQLFGTQYRFNKELGMTERLPIESEEFVDARRAEIGLPPLAKRRVEKAPE